MTIVGYGDKAPVTLPGRILALIWVFSGSMLISTVTAAITSALTVASLDTGIQGPKDLPRAKTGTVMETTSALYLAERGINAQPYSTVEDAVESLALDKIEALVYDTPILSYPNQSDPNPYLHPRSVSRVGKILGKRWLDKGRKIWYFFFEYGACTQKTKVVKNG